MKRKKKPYWLRFIIVHWKIFFYYILFPTDWENKDNPKNDIF